MALARAHILASGLVQGVFYRRFVQTKANSYSLNGWVRNLPNGQVELACEGEKGLILDFAKELRVGPPSANVAGLEIEWQDYVGDFDNFRIRL
jgi:acylphosphatase